MITRAQKEERVKDIVADMQNAKLIILTDYRGLDVGEISNLRRELRGKDCKYRVVKNTLSKLAAQEVGLESLHPYLEGPTAIAFGNDDPVEATKALLKWVKETDNLSIKVGLLDGKMLEMKEIENLGAIPPQDVLLAKLCGAFQAPIRGLATALEGNINKLVCVLDNIRREKEAS